MENFSELSNFAVRELTTLFYFGAVHRDNFIGEEEPPKKYLKDLELIGKVSDLIFCLPESYSFKYKKALPVCCRHGRQWVFNSTNPIDDSDPTVTYALVKEKLRSFIADLVPQLSWEEPVHYKHLLIAPSFLDHEEQQFLEKASNVLVILYNCGNLINSDVPSVKKFFHHDANARPSFVFHLASDIFRRAGRKKINLDCNLNLCYKIGKILFSKSRIWFFYRGTRCTYAYMYKKLEFFYRTRLKESKPPQELPVLKPKPADAGSEVTHYQRLKLDRGGRVFRIGSDISHSGSDISPIWTSPLLASLLDPLNIVTQRGMLYFYCKQILSGENEVEVELEYVEHLHILLQSDSRLDEFVPKEVVTYLMDSLVYENIFNYLELEDIDTQTHIISILCNAVRSLEIGEEMRNNIIENLMRLIESDSMYVQAELLFGLARLSKFDEYRHHLLKLGILEKLVKVARRGNNVILPDCALLFSVICFSERNLPVDKGDAAIQIAIYLIKHRGCNHEVTAQAFSALAYLSEGKYVAIEGASCKRLMLYISDDEDSVAVSALEVVGNIVRWGKVRQITIMIKNGILKHLQRLLSHKFIMVRKEACWIISNITVGRKMYLKDLYEVNLPYSLCNLLEADDLDLRMEAVWAIFNSIIYNDHDGQIDYPNRSHTCPYILGQTRKIAPAPSVRVMVNRWSDYVPYVKK